ncbi:glucosamine-6-phosphate deaminase [Motiliproteus sp. MSK22-1]|uniref:glucosamine-6-phosphate deaminase n=1 Tax=Motiliproteus sp. MSK22-1 TaxID=1897630 RepID=UPI000978279D|nr:glucosamine-6-phosphate deaminase [Motiliproteus sp. MSK22-1]OMH33887.1 glucosamine-6-phosphate deaminase [Motiliproteus sp. MSK22-1]
MQVVIAESAQEVAQLGADHICRLIKNKPAAVLGLATGSTPIALYQELISRFQHGILSFSQVRSFNLDEYVGLEPDHPQSYRHFMNHQLFKHININLQNTHLPDGTGDPVLQAERYEAQIREAGGIDLQVLGLGRNGHIGFNEPCSSLGSATRIKTLTPETLRDNSRFFSSDEFQPTLAITMGIGTIHRARKALLLATGKAKAEAVKQMVEGPLSASCPASALQMHPHAVVVVDPEAGALLTHHDYYHRVRAETDLLAMEHYQ